MHCTCNILAQAWIVNEKDSDKNDYGPQTIEYNLDCPVCQLGLSLADNNIDDGDYVTRGCEQLFLPFLSS